MPETILIDIDEGVARITLNRPHRNNSIDITMCKELYENLMDISYRMDVNVLVLTGAGDTFCPGGDIKAIVSGEMAEQQAAGYNRMIYRIPAVLHNMPQLTVAAINGSCAGAGLGWACGCDLRYSTESAKFTTAFLDRGFAGDMSVPWSLPRIVGPAKARQLSFLPDVIDAREAERIGLVNDVFEDAHFRSEFDTVLERLRNANPPAVLALKERYVMAESMQSTDYADFETRSPGGFDASRFAQSLAKRKSAAAD